MLNSLRKASKGWVASVLVGLLVLAFATWGVGDIFRGATDPNVAVVGDIDISASRLDREFRTELERYRALSGGNFSAQQAVALGLVQQTLNRIVTDAAYAQETYDLGLAVDDQIVAQVIRSTPAFQDSLTGEFRREYFEYSLQQSRMSEEQYVASVRANLVRQTLLDGISTGITVPKPMLEQLYRFREQRRVADIAVISVGNLESPPDPDDAVLRTFYEENPEQFTAPEYRSITLVALRPADFLDEVDVSEDEVRDEYEARQDEYFEPERRDIDVIVFGDKAAAEAAQTEINDGRDFLEVGAEATGMSAEEFRQGQILADELPSLLSDPVFALEAGEISEPLESGFGWNIVRVNEIITGKNIPFEDARAEVEEKLKLVSAGDVVFDLSNNLLDELAGGASLEQAAASVGASTENFAAADALGQGDDGKRLDNLAELEQVLSAAFELAEGAESDVIETDDGAAVIVRVDSITAPVVKPFETVRIQALLSWQSENRQQRAELLAQEIATSAAEIGDLAVAASRLAVPVQTTSPFTRDGRDLGLPLGRQTVDAIFGLESGEVSGAVAEDGGRYVVAQLKEIVETAPDTVAENDLEVLTNQLNSALANDLVASYSADVRERLGVNIYEDRINKLLIEPVLEQ